MSHGLLLVTVAAVLQSGGEDRALIPLFRSEVGGFSIELPSTPTASIRNLPSPDGPIVNKIYQVASSKGLIMVICSDPPRKVSSADVDSMFLKGLKDGYIKRPGSKLLSQKKVSFEGVTAWEVIVQMPIGTMRSRYFVKNDRIYQILMGHLHPTDDDPAGFQTFADSFRSIPRVGKLTDPEARPSAWNSYRSRGGGYTIRMIGEPTEQPQSLKTPAGPVEAWLTLGSNERGEDFGVSYCPIPKTSSATTPEAFFDAAVQGAVANVKGKVVSRRVIDYDGRPGTEVMIALPATRSITDAVFLVRIYWSEDRLYQVFYLGPRSNANGKEALDFLNSFQIDGVKRLPAPAPAPLTSKKSKSSTK